MDRRPSVFRTGDIDNGSSGILDNTQLPLNSEDTMGRNASPRTAKVSSFPRDALEQAQIVKFGWDEVGTKLMVPNLTIAGFEAKLDEAKQCAERAEEFKLERAKAIQERNVILGELWDLTKRIRNAAKATFGDHSSELELLISPHNVDQEDSGAK